MEIRPSDLPALRGRRNRMVNDAFQLELDHYYNYRNQSFVRYTHRIRIERLRELIHKIAALRGRRNSATALDAGSGFGVYSILMAEAGYDVVGVDINEEEIRQAKQWSAARRVQDRIEFRVGDLERMNDGSDAFDLIVCSEVLEHLDQPTLGARNLYRLLKPGGVAIISMPNMACLLGAMQWCYRKSGLRALLGKPPLDLHQIQHSRYWFGNILQILREAGFRVDKVESTSLLPFWWEIDAFLTKRLGIVNLCGRLDDLISRLPGFNYLGFNLIVLSRKP
jgi:2-polyprenyl-3-methyl-5-hydroxy-6-metoxy-1,4-benzoquinol methylase